MQTGTYDMECLEVFLKKQRQLFQEVKDYFEEEGMDISGMDDQELEEASEVFALPDGRYLVVEG